MSDKPKIYIFRNNDQVQELENMFVAVNEQGYTLRWQYIAAKDLVLYRIIMGGLKSVHMQYYRLNYPDGFQLVFIDDIRLPEYRDLRERLARASLEKQKLNKAVKKLTDDIESKVTAALEEHMKNVAVN